MKMIYGMDRLVYELNRILSVCWYSRSFLMLSFQMRSEFRRGVNAKSEGVANNLAIIVKS